MSVSMKSAPAPTATPPWATTIVIPTTWTPEQALAVFELLDDLRDRLWTLHGSQIQDLLHQQQGSAASYARTANPDAAAAASF
jgi:hypothetical protein